MTNTRPLARLQREILAAVEAHDDAALKRIVAREGIDPDLWEFFMVAMRETDDLARTIEPRAEEPSAS